MTALTTKQTKQTEPRPEPKFQKGDKARFYDAIRDELIDGKIAEVEPEWGEVEQAWFYYFDEGDLFPYPVEESDLRKCD